MLSFNSIIFGGILGGGDSVTTEPMSEGSALSTCAGCGIQLISTSTGSLPVIVRIMQQLLTRLHWPRKATCSVSNHYFVGSTVRKSHVHT